MTGGVVVPENVVLRSICTSTEAEPRAKESQGKPSKAKQKPSQAVVVWREGRGGKGTKNNNRGGGLCRCLGGEGRGRTTTVGGGGYCRCLRNSWGGCTVVVGRGGTTTPPTPTLL